MNDHTYVRIQGYALIMSSGRYMAGASETSLASAAMLLVRESDAQALAADMNKHRSLLGLPGGIRVEPVFESVPADPAPVACETPALRAKIEERFTRALGIVFLVRIPDLVRGGKGWRGELGHAFPDVSSAVVFESYAVAEATTYGGGGEVVPVSREALTLLREIEGSAARGVITLERERAASTEQNKIQRAEITRQRLEVTDARQALALLREAYDRQRDTIKRYQADERAYAAAEQKIANLTAAWAALGAGLTPRT